MGYYTRYSLDLENTGSQPVDLDEVYQAVVDQSGYSDPFDDTIKWYDHEDHILAVSSRYPTVFFGLEGEGEEAGDLWRKYFLGGKVQVAKASISFAPFDKALLK